MITHAPGQADVEGGVLQRNSREAGGHLMPWQTSQELGDKSCPSIPKRDP